jgi:hypothetical protein
MIQYLLTGFLLSIFIMDCWMVKDFLSIIQDEPFNINIPRHRFFWNRFLL